PPILLTPVSPTPAAATRPSPLSLHDALPILPALRVDGELQLGAETVELRGWSGMQGHNWGSAQAHAYAWGHVLFGGGGGEPTLVDRKSTRLNSSHDQISYAVFCLKKKKKLRA